MSTSPGRSLLGDAAGKRGGAGDGGRRSAAGSVGGGGVRNGGIASGAGVGRTGGVGRVGGGGVRRAGSALDGACAVYVECSPVQKVFFLTYTGRGYARRNPDGGLLTGATCRLAGNERYVRVECVDGVGRTAWTNPIFFDERAEEGQG